MDSVKVAAIAYSVSLSIFIFDHSGNVIKALRFTDSATYTSKQYMRAFAMPNEQSMILVFYRNSDHANPFILHITF